MAGGVEKRTNETLNALDVEGFRDEEFDDDGKPRRTGTVWTASAHIITAVIGSGVLSLAWAMAQVGWIAGITALVLFAIVTIYTSCLLADCYRSSDPMSGKRNNTYIDAVKSNLGEMHVWFCGICQYANLFGITIGYTITASISIAAVSKSICFHKSGPEADCSVSISEYMILFGFIQIFLSQLQNFHKLSWLSIVAAIMSFTYALIAVGLPLDKILSGKSIGETSITGLKVGMDISPYDKVWKTFQALGDVAFAYSYSQILIEIQDTLKSPPAENKVMKKASRLGVSITTTFYLLCGCVGYAAFGNHAPGNILTGFYEPYWLVIIAHICIVVHLIGAFQVFAQPLFAVVEAWITGRFPNLSILNREFSIINAKNFKFNINIFRLIWRTCYVIMCTLLAIIMPFFNAVLAFLGALGFWPLTVYFPITMYISQKRIERFTTRWMVLQTLSFLCFLISLGAACSSIQGVRRELSHYTPFQTRS